MLLALAPLAAGLGLVFLVVCVVLGVAWWLGLILGIVMAAGLVWWQTRGAAARLLDRMGAERLPEGEFRRFENLVDGLSLSTGLVGPELWILRDSSLNGSALASGETNAIVLTTGLLEAADRVELEAVIAALLSRLKSGDAEAATIVSALFGKPVLESGAGRVLIPLAARAFRTVFTEFREVENDLEAVEVTRYPPALLSVLQRIQRGPSEPAGTTPGLKHLWFAPPHPAPSVPNASLSFRLDVLSES